ncbi:hypothetical protein BdWA1_002744 [Babesia duncani]|uniref:Uncharacterized protein n=1 Tax=Babesia duncani TaxID=323732 RepID=A0AAD9PK17_9APIC|nr:hypothetical protein BdWA1_002744 [Babesia duncani]
MFKCADKTPYRIPAGTLHLNLNRKNRIVNYQDAITQYRIMLSQSGIEKIANERPERHYPAHHYKRIMKQRMPFLIAENRREAWDRRHTEIKEENKIEKVTSRHLPNILKAVDYYEAWLNNFNETSNKETISDKA